MMTEVPAQPPAALVGGFVRGSYSSKRTVTLAEALYRAYHEDELPVGFDNREAYASLFQYPAEDYAPHFAKTGSPKGYAGPTSCPRLAWDVDNKDLDAALAGTRKLIRALRERYGEGGLGLYFSGRKGFHLTLPAPGHTPRPQVPGTAKKLCLAVAASAGVEVDTTIYDHQRLFRLPNTRHPRSGLYKRCFDLDEFDRLDLTRILKAAGQPSGAPVPEATEDSPQLQVDWKEAEVAVSSRLGVPVAGAARAAGNGLHPVLARCVRDFIGFGDLQNPSRAVTLFQCAAALSESALQFGWPAVIGGLLEYPALASGLELGEVRRQIESGIAYGVRPR